MILGRNTLAERLDCYLGCDCGADRVRYQVLFDKILYDLDRAIDFYALGTTPQGDGEPEARAATFGLIATTVLDHIPLPSPPQPPFRPFVVRNALTLEENRDRTDAEIDEAQRRLDAHLADLHGLGPQTDATHKGVVEQIRQAARQLLLGIGVRKRPRRRHVRSDPVRAGNMLQELCLQQDSQEQWTSLLHTMAPSCHVSGSVLRLTQAVLDVTRIRYFGRLHCPPIDATIPAPLATSNAAYPFREHSEGGR